MDGLRTDSPGCINIDLDFAAVGKPRMTRRDKWKKRPCVVKYRAWCDRVREIVGQVPDANRIQAVSWDAYFAMPSSWREKRRREMHGKLHRSKPDRDNIDKAILDLLWPKNDSAIACGSISKYWSDRDHLTIFIRYE